MYMIKLLMEMYGFYVLAMIVFLVFSSNDLFGYTDLQRISDMFVLRHIINETLITNNDEEENDFKSLEPIAYSKTINLYLY
jgi:hypothetical protein